MGTITLVTGGSRSGKSTFAFKEASRFPQPRTFVATAIAFDDEMRDRIAKHQTERAGTFETVEAPYDLSACIDGIGSRTSVVLIDCLTVWLGNLFHRCEENEQSILEQVDLLCQAVVRSPHRLFLVTNEVGMGIVPENRMARHFRDVAGIVNQRIAAIADEVHLCCCGIAIPIKKGNGSRHA